MREPVVGEFFLEETFLFKHGGMASKPDVHFRDGRVFPQDKLMNCTLHNRHGQLTREAIYRMVTTARTARELKILYCGVAKQVQLRVYSTLVNWFITRQMGKPRWNLTNQVLSDTEGEQGYRWLRCVSVPEWCRSRLPRSAVLLGNRTEGTNYMVFYHFLEGLADYDNWEKKIKLGLPAANPAKRQVSSEIDNWAKRANMYDSFKKVIERFQDNIIVLSYRDGGVPDPDTIRLLLKVFKKTVTLHSVPNQYVLSKSRANELLFIAK